MLPSHKTLLEMIEQAMKTKAPQMYAGLRAEGALQAEIARRSEEAKDSYREATGVQSAPEVQRMQRLPYLEQVQERTMQLRVAASKAIDLATEFPNEREVDGDVL